MIWGYEWWALALMLIGAYRLGELARAFVSAVQAGIKKRRAAA